MLSGFKLRGPITRIRVIAVGGSIRDLRKLRKLHGRGRWRKLKGEALVELLDGTVWNAELHWYEAHGIGRRGMKVKKLLS
jgi:hypothetical protein